jgi:hypothetical protein
VTVPQSSLRPGGATPAGGDTPTYPDCGTATAYERHRRDHTSTCEPCKAANSKAKQQQGHSKARGRAFWALAARPDHKAEFEQLAASYGADKRRRDKAVRELARRHPGEFQRLLTDEFVRLAVDP